MENIGKMISWDPKLCPLYNKRGLTYSVPFLEGPLSEALLCQYGTLSSCVHILCVEADSSRY